MSRRSRFSELLKTMEIEAAKKTAPMVDDYAQQVLVHEHMGGNLEACSSKEVMVCQTNKGGQGHSPFFLGSFCRA